MPHDGDRGASPADLLEDAMAAALAAVERREASPAATVVPIAAAEVEPAAPALPEADKLRLELEMSQERARKVFDQLKLEHEQRLRAAADLENYRKRAARERDELQRYGIERLVKELLPVVDSLDRALAAAGDHPLTTGVAMTRRLLEDALARFGVKGFSAAGASFDPHLHEALMTMATSACPPGVVIEEQQRGFFLHDRLIRPAAVVVSVAPPPPAGGGAAPGDEP